MLNDSQLHKLLVQQFPGCIGQLNNISDEESQIRIKPEALHDVCTYLLRTPELHFDFLRHIMMMPAADRLIAVYYLYSFEHGHEIALRVDMPKNVQQLKSMADLWAGADQLEDEVMHRLGIQFAAV